MPTVIPFDKAVLADPDFASPDHLGVYTRWIEESFLPRIDPSTLTGDGALHRGGDGRPMTRMWIELDGKRVELGLPSAFAAGVAAGSFAGGARAADSVSGGTETADDPSADPDTIVSIITGTVVRWLVDDGATVAADEPVVVLEAMKMETQIPAPHAGILHTSAAVGAQVRFGDRLGHVESA